MSPEVVGRLRPPRLASAPASPANGELYFDTATSKLYWYNGTAWVAADTASDASTSAKGVVQLAGDLAGTATSPQIASGVIVNADIAAAAAIAASKLAGYPTNAAKALFGDGSWLGGAAVLYDGILGAAGQFNWTTVPTTHKHLLAICSFRDNAGGTAVTNASLRINGATANYNYAYGLINNNTVSAGGAHGTQAQLHAGDIPGSTQSTADLSSSIYFFPNVNVSGIFHGFIGFVWVDGGSAANDRIQVVGGSYFGDTNVVSQIYFFSAATGNNFATGSRVTIYGFGV